MSHHAQRLAGIYEHVLAEPDDDTHRLVYADALEERAEDDDLARAEFIRVQIGRARTPHVGLGLPDGYVLESCQHCRLRRREQELLHAHSLAWTASLPLGTVYDFRRGFVAVFGSPSFPVAPRTLPILAGPMARLPLEEIVLGGQDGLQAHWPEDVPHAGVAALCREVIDARPALERLRWVVLVTANAAVQLAVYAWLGDKLAPGAWMWRRMAVLLWERLRMGRYYDPKIRCVRPGELEVWDEPRGCDRVVVTGLRACPHCGHAPLAPVPPSAQARYCEATHRCDACGGTCL